VVVHRPCARVVFVPPNFIEKLIPRDHALGVLRQKLQCLNSFGVTMIFSPARVISVLEKSTICWRASENAVFWSSAELDSRPSS
jgi:hypothetical protein